ncbi:MAG: GNAT family N-acetyltransferase [Candidatus Marinimicrobia bacterium]|nr:GNAT family N-acetyltransferase [Candidatus Neomarinimicrobiota bacterium]
MAFNYKKFNPENANVWDAFIDGSVNGTLFHTRKFLSYHNQDRFQDFSIEFYHKNKLFSVFPAVDIHYEGKRTLLSHRGASYGGFVYNEGLSIREAHDLVGDLVKMAKEYGFQKIMMTLPPVIYERRLSNYIDFALIKNGFQYQKREVSSIVRLENSIEENVSKFKQTNRTAFRKAQKLGVEIRQSEDYEEFYRILKKNLKIRHNVQPTHTLEELIRLKTLFPNKIRFFGAYVKSEMVAGVVMFDCNAEVTLAFYISHKESMQEFRGVNLLFYHIIKDAIEKGFHYLDFGIFTVNMEPNFGLGRFKEGFGSSGVLRDTFILDI